MDAFKPFFVAALPEIRFGAGKIDETVEVLSRFGQKALLVTGRRSFSATPHWQRLLKDLKSRGIAWEQVRVEDEPSPALVDEAVARFKGADIQVVAGIGGGSVLDAAKAIAGLLTTGNSVLEHLEGVGRSLPYLGPAVPLVAVPTTAGTGSEATKNAVLSVRGAEGFKKSFRHEQLVARVAIVDPQLLATCPKSLIAADGMDAFTQLLESYVSANASSFTDALALSGLENFRDGFWAAWGPPRPDAAAGYGRIAYASLLSGITLAQAGLGSVHGLASPLGAYFPIPHGVVCGTLVAEATAVNLHALREREPDSPALAKYARIAELLTQRRFSGREQAGEALVALLRDWLQRLELPRLGTYGMGPEQLNQVVANCRGGSMKTNPLVLSDAELRGLLESRM
jgi:alcohol dehydrogenase class IV